MCDGARAAASRTMVDHIPVVWVEPDGERDGSPLAVWMPALGIDKEWVAPFLSELAAAGFVAVSFDPWQHGERRSESAEELRARVFAQFRRRVWPIFGHTALELITDNGHFGVEQGLLNAHIHHAFGFETQSPP